MNKNELKYELPIQFFAEGGAEDSSTGGAKEPTGGETKSFDDLLEANKDYQSEFDKRIAKALETNSSKLNSDFDKKLAEALKEQQRLSGLDEKSKAEELEKAKQKEFEEREAKLSRKELEAEVKDLLSEASLTKDFLDFVVASDVESSRQRINALTELINSQVEKGVQNKISSSGAPGGASGSSLDEAISNAFSKKYQINKK